MDGWMDDDSSRLERSRLAQRRDEEFSTLCAELDAGNYVYAACVLLGIYDLLVAPRDRAFRLKSD